MSGKKHTIAPETVKQKSPVIYLINEFERIKDLPQDEYEDEKKKWREDYSDLNPSDIETFEFLTNNGENKGYITTYQQMVGLGLLGGGGSLSRKSKSRKSRKYRKSSTKRRRRRKRQSNTIKRKSIKRKTNRRRSKSNRKKLSKKR